MQTHAHLSNFRLFYVQAHSSVPPAPSDHLVGSDPPLLPSCLHAYSIVKDFGVPKACLWTTPHWSSHNILSSRLGKWVVSCIFTDAEVEMPGKGFVHSHPVEDSQSPEGGSSLPTSASKGHSCSSSSPSVEWFPGHHPHPHFSFAHIHALKVRNQTDPYPHPSSAFNLQCDISQVS